MKKTNKVLGIEREHDGVSLDSLLDKWYNEEGLTTYEIAEKCNVHHSTIGDWMDKYEMERRSSSESQLSSDAYKPTEEELDQWYNEEGLSTIQIAEKCNVTNGTIGKWMDKYGMERRPAAHLPKEPEYTIEQACEAYLKYEKTTAIPVDLRTFFNIFDPETLQRAEGTPPLRVYISRWKRDRDK